MKRPPGTDTPAVRATNGKHHTPPTPISPFDRAAEFTDAGNARRFAASMQGEFLYCGGRGSWFAYDGMRWKVDDALTVVKAGLDVMQTYGQRAWEIADEDARKKAVLHAIRSHKRRGIDDMLSLARPFMPVEQSAFDTQPFALNCLNGTVDLRTRKISAHDPADLITRLVPLKYDPTAYAPRFKRFLREIFITKAGEPDQDLIEFVHVFLGYACTADVREDLLLLCCGEGRNGKTTLFEVIAKVLGEYAQHATPEVFLTHKTDGASASPQIARLAGARLVMMAELPATGALAEGTVKSLTGGDTQTARFLHANEFNFVPTAKFILRTNDKPRIRGTGSAIWDRIAEVPFNARFEPGTAACDSGLKETLADELPGILRWLVDGAALWHANGLPKRPSAVVHATSAYRSRENVFEQFIEDKCVRHATAHVLRSKLFRVYKAWHVEAAANKSELLNKQRFNAATEEYLKTPPGPLHGNMCWFGLGLRADVPNSAAEGAASDEVDCD